MLNVFGLIRFFVDGVVLLLGDGFGIVWFFFGCWVFEG